MARRSGKFYSKNEKEIMERFGLKPTIASGSTMLEKEDGFNDNIICQHKSTDANSYRISLDDIEKLEYHAMVEHKTPVFMIQFLKNDDIYLVLRPEDIEDIYNHLTLPKSSSNRKLESQEHMIEIENKEINKTNKRKMINSGNKQKYDKMREKEQKEKDEKFKRERKANVKQISNR